MMTLVAFSKHPPLFALSLLIERVENIHKTIRTSNSTNIVTEQMRQSRSCRK